VEKREIDKCESGRVRRGAEKPFFDLSGEGGGEKDSAEKKTFSGKEGEGKNLSREGSHEVSLGKGDSDEERTLLKRYYTIGRRGRKIKKRREEE